VNSERTQDTAGHVEGDARTDAATEAFLAHRNLLFTVAYEMLGSAADAEDVLQETWLRWAGVDLDTVRDQRAYLVRITTRQALTRLRTLGRRKESYVGPWLPEPLLTTPDVAEDVELADSVSMAMLLVLETLTPTERAKKVSQLLAIGLETLRATASLHPAQVNGYPALVIRIDGELDTVVALRIDDGLITGMYAVRNPAKLSHMQHETALRR
jgi:DNA-directed RNA polymerase specialized sigma24 family protein